MTLRFEEIEIGRICRFGRYAVSEEEVLEFARRYDPQAMHLDPRIGATSPVFERLAASGVHILAIAGRLQVDYWKTIAFTPIAGLGIREMRLRRPVYPGDTLSITTCFDTKRLRRSTPGQGIATSYVEVFNQHEEKVMDFNGAVLVHCLEARVR